MFLRRVFLAAASGAALVLLLAALTLGALPDKVQAGPAGEIIVVTTDEPGIADDGLCSLTEAILNANNDDQSGSRDCLPGQGVDRIVFAEPPRRIIFLAPYKDKNGLPPITSHIIIEGQQTVLRRSDHAPPLRFFWVEETGFLELNDITLENGLIDANPQGYYGGAILNRGQLIIRRSLLRDNEAVYGGGVRTSGKTTILQSRLINNLALKNGGGIEAYGDELVIQESLLQGNEAGNDGGAILDSSRLMTITLSEISDNEAEHGGGVALLGERFYPANQFQYDFRVSDTQFRRNVASQDGGGLYILAHGNLYKSCAGPLPAIVKGELTRANFQENRSNGNGGGIAVATRSTGTAQGSSELHLRQSSVLNNHAGGHGGGIFNHVSSQATCSRTVNPQGLVFIEDSLIAGNVAEKHGGGIYNFGGRSTQDVQHIARVALENATVSGNRSLEAGGGISNESPLSRSVPDPSARLALTHVTLTRNEAPVGGGLYHTAGVTAPVTMTPTAGVVISNSIIAGMTQGEDCFLGDYGLIESAGTNLESGTSCHLDGPGDMQNADPGLQPLQDNGGPTRTHALSPGSPAIDHIPAGTNGCTPHASRDQRGALRASGPGHGGDACDVGAFEANSDPGFCLVDDTPPEGDFVFPKAGMTVTPPLLLAAEGDDGPGFGLGVVRFTWAPVGGPWQRIPGCQFETIAAGESQFDCVWDMAGAPDGKLWLGIELHDRVGNVTTHIRPLTKQSGPPDTTPPSGDLIQPQNGSVHAPPVWLTAFAQDDRGIGMVRFTAQVNGTWRRLGLVGWQPPPYEHAYSYRWDMAGVPEGPVTVGVEIYDQAGNRAPSPPWRTRTFTKQDAPGWTPTPTPAILCTPSPSPTPASRLWLPIIVNPR